MFLTDDCHVTTFGKGWICYLWCSFPCSLRLCAKIIQANWKRDVELPPPAYSTLHLGLRSRILDPASPSQEHHQSLHPWGRDSQPSGRAKRFQQTPVCAAAMSSLVTRPRFYLRLEKELDGFHPPLQPIPPAVGAKGWSRESLRKIGELPTASPASRQG